jgi:hypothetical protein
LRFAGKGGQGLRSSEQKSPYPFMPPMTNAVTERKNWIASLRSQ